MCGLRNKHKQPTPALALMCMMIQAVPEDPRSEDRHPLPCAEESHTGLLPPSNQIFEMWDVKENQCHTLYETVGCRDAA